MRGCTGPMTVEVDDVKFTECEGAQFSVFCCNGSMTLAWLHRGQRLFAVSHKGQGSSAISMMVAFSCDFHWLFQQISLP